MSKKEKLIQTFSTKPLRRDITFEEMESLFKLLGYIKKEGKGSRVRFSNPETGDIFTTNKPHPGNILKTYVVKEVYEKIKEIAK
jgi:predicted RNA binding protein YcfA (HicA-like mRNA interferase family)